MADETRLATSFTDVKDREWFPRLTMGALDEFERHTGVGVFEALFDIMFGKIAQTEIDAGEDDPQEVIAKAVAGGLGVNVDSKTLLDIGRRVFGKVGNLRFLLYECCKNSKGAVVDDAGSEVNYFEFGHAIQKKHLGPACACAFGILLDGFPDMSEAVGELRKAGQPGRPPEGGPGETSTNSPGSPE